MVDEILCMVHTNLFVWNIIYIYVIIRVQCTYLSLCIYIYIYIHLYTLLGEFPEMMLHAFGNNPSRGLHPKTWFEELSLQDDSVGLPDWAAQAFFGAVIIHAFRHAPRPDGCLRIMALGFTAFGASFIMASFWNPAMRVKAWVAGIPLSTLHAHTLTHPSIRGQISPIGRPWVLGTWGLRHTTFRHGTAIRSATSALWRWQFLPLRSQGRVLQWNKIRTLHTQNFQLPCIAHDFIRDILLLLLLLLRLCISLQYRSCCGYRSFATNIPKKSWSMWKQYDEILKACCLNCADSAGSVQPRSCAKTTNSRRWSSVMVPIILNNCV